MNIELFKTGLTSILKITKEAPVLIEVRNGRLIVASHDDFHAVIFEMKADLEDFKLVLSEKLARQLPKQLDGSFSLSIDGRTAKIKTKGSTLKLTTLDPDALSLAKLVKNYTKDIVWKTNGSTLKSAIKKVMHSANDRSIGDIVLRGYHMNIEEGEVEVMASNGASMSLTEFTLKEGKEPKLLLLNQEFFKAVNLLYDDEVSISYNHDALTLQSSDDDSTIRLISLLTKGKSFNYKNVLQNVEQPYEDGESYKCTFEAKELRDVLKKLTFFFDETTKYKVQLSLSKDTMTLSSDNVYGNAEYEVSLVDSDLEDDLEIYISGANLNSYLSSIPSSDEVTMVIRDQATPVLFIDSLGKEIITVFNV